MTDASGLQTTLRVAGGWVRDKLLATEPFSRDTYVKDKQTVNRLTSKFAPSKGRKGTSIISSSIQQQQPQKRKDLIDIQPLDIDIALDDMLGREFADQLNEYLLQHGRERVSVGMVMKNPEKSKHLETATMKVGKFWIDFVNLRAEEYAENSRIPDLMRIGTPEEDAFRRDLTINVSFFTNTLYSHPHPHPHPQFQKSTEKRKNICFKALFYNINKRCVEDFTGRGVDDLKKGVVATPLHPLTTLLDDPLRVLRSIRFAARLRFTMDEALRKAAKNIKVRQALAVKVSRERIGGEVDLMLRSPDPVGALRLLVNLELADTVFSIPEKQESKVFYQGLNLISITHDYLCDCKLSPPIWCQMKSKLLHVNDVMLMDDEEARRLLWYSAFLKPLRDYYTTTTETATTNTQTESNRKMGKKKRQSVIMKLMLDQLKRPSRDAEAIEQIMKAADGFTKLINHQTTDIAKSILLNGLCVKSKDNKIICGMQKLQTEVVEEVTIDSVHTDGNLLWNDAMKFRLQCAEVLLPVKSLWRASLILSLSEQLAQLNFDIAIEEDVVSSIIQPILPFFISISYTSSF